MEQGPLSALILPRCFIPAECRSFLPGARGGASAPCASSTSSSSLDGKGAQPDEQLCCTPAPVKGGKVAGAGAFCTQGAASLVPRELWGGGEAAPVPAAPRAAAGWPGSYTLVPPYFILFYFVNAVLLLACNLNYFEERFFIFFFRFPSDLNGSFERQASPFTSTLSGLNQSCGQLWWRGGGGKREKPHKEAKLTGPTIGVIDSGWRRGLDAALCHGDAGALGEIQPRLFPRTGRAQALEGVAV